MIVEDVKKEWREMEGKDLRTKLINAYLTHQFILTGDVPSDECLREADKILSGEDVFETLRLAFACGYSMEYNNTLVCEEMLPQVQSASEVIQHILNGDPEKVARTLSW